jgi:hypothetical protein
MENHHLTKIDTIPEMLRFLAANRRILYVSTLCPEQAQQEAPKTSTGAALPRCCSAPWRGPQCCGLCGGYCEKVQWLGEGTVKVHLAALFRALGVRSRSAAAAKGALIASENAAAPAERGRNAPT